MASKQLLTLIALVISSTFLSATVKAQAGTEAEQTVDSLSKVVGTPLAVDSENFVFEKPEVAPSVDMRMWRRHLETQLLPYIINAAQAKMRPGSYTVSVRFLVETDGSISNVKALNDPGYGLARGSEMVVKTGPKWKAGEQNGKKVRSYH